MVPEENSGPGLAATVCADPVDPHETPVDAGCTRAQLEEGARRLATARAVLELRSVGRGWKAIESELGVDHVTAWRLHRRAVKLGPDRMSAEAFAPGRPGPERRQPFTPTERDQVRALALLSNRNRHSGSLPEAARRAIRTGALRPELAERLSERESAGLPILTPAMRREVRVGPAAVRAFRNPREAWLEYIQSPGSLMLTVDGSTGEERPVEPGEAWTIDDGTINLVCNVPTSDPRWKHGVMPGRFQFLLIVDHRSYFIPGFCYTARPRGSYRAEDLMATLHNAMTEHGAPRRLVLEKGISASDSITRMCQLAGIQIDRASSPHQKVVELVFGCLWTKLSFLPGQVGRYRGEEAEITAILESCRAGSKDPRDHFPMLGEVLAAMREAIADWNDHTVAGSRYGQWVPSEYWQRVSGKWLRPIADADAWIFAPRVTEPLKVRGAQIATSVLLAPGFTEQFTFAAGWLCDYVGARVSLHFNPLAPDSAAKAVLCGAFGGQASGTVLGDLEMIDRQARWTRRNWGYSDEEDIGRQATSRNAAALHRSAQAIRPDGKPGVTRVDVVDGLPGQEETGRRGDTETRRRGDVETVRRGEDDLVRRRADAEDFERSHALEFV